MSLKQQHAKIKSAIWQAIAQSGVDLSSISSEDQTKLVDQIAERVLGATDEILGEVSPRPPGAPQEHGIEAEKVLWEGRPFLSVVEVYTLTDERLKIVRGLLSREFENFELIRVQDLDVTQGAFERMLDVGDIHIKGADASNPEIVLRNVRDPHGAYELIRLAWLAARKKHGLVFREEM